MAHHPLPITKDNKLDLNKLSPNQKKILAKKLTNDGYSSRSIADYLGAGFATITRWAKETTPEDLKRFETQFESELAIAKKRGVSLALKRIYELLPEETNLDRVTKTAQYLENKPDQNASNQFTINVKNLDISSKPSDPYGHSAPQAIEGEEG